MTEIAADLGQKTDTLRKAVRQGRLILKEPDQRVAGIHGNTKSERTQIDNHTPMGKSCSNTIERILASTKGIEAPIRFEQQIDLSCAGVLLSLPALLSNGLLTHSSDFKLAGGYYSEESIFLCLAFLCLLRIKTLNQSDTIPCGELGRVMGLDRIPEVKTLRSRIDSFTKAFSVLEWSKKLSQGWMEANEDMAGVLYVDGHVNIYYGHATSMPRRYVSRLRLCMSGSTDYYVNDKTGQPFFVVSEVINGSMIEKIKQDILPRLEQEVPNQPTGEALAANPRLGRFMIVTDRECYSVDFFDYLWQKRVAICTYRKNVKDNWPQEEFVEYEQTDEDGNIVKLKLVEREVVLKNSDSKSPKEVTVREVRKLSESGHQTAIITTNFMMSIIQIGLYMFARWCQENFFKYMVQSFDIDTLVSYSTHDVSDTKILVNPDYRKLESELKSLNGKLANQRTRYAKIDLILEELDDKKLKRAITKMTKIYEQITILESQIIILKEKMRSTHRKISFAELPEQQKFSNVINERKHFMDNIKMISYRAETAMFNLIKPQMNVHHRDEGRKLLQQVYKSDADITPDYQNKTLTIKLHNLTYKKDDKVVQYLCDRLNETETIFPGTDLTLIYKLVSA